MVNKPPALTLVAPAPIGTFPTEDQALIDEMFAAYARRRLGGQRHTQKTFEADHRRLLELGRFTRQPPWFWNKELFEEWCYHLGHERFLAVSSQRKYQSAIRTFINYLIETPKFRNLVLQKYGVVLIQFCTADNCIPHVADRELSTVRRAMTFEELGRFFATIDQDILEARRWGSKNVHPLCRDRAMFFYIYTCGLRVSEAVGTNVGSFQPNPRQPELGNFGIAHVWGKGSRGSGPRHRAVPIDNINLPPMLKWYLAEVRQHFLHLADPNEEAMFLSERGHRLARATIEGRFAAIRERAGLDRCGLTLHSMRHSSVTHGRLIRSGEAMRLKHGHVHSATTEGYNDPPDEFVRDELDSVITAQLRDLAAEKEKSNG